MLCDIVPFSLSAGEDVLTPKFPNVFRFTVIQEVYSNVYNRIQFCFTSVKNSHCLTRSLTQTVGHKFITAASRTKTYIRSTLHNIGIFI
jgi:hypothetical protein